MEKLYRLGFEALPQSKEEALSYLSSLPRAEVVDSIALEHLKNGIDIFASPILVIDAYDGKCISDCLMYYTDGRWVWTNVYRHYAERLRLTLHPLFLRELRDGQLIYGGRSIRELCNRFRQGLASPPWDS